MTGLPTILRRPCICREEALPAGDDGLEICGTARQDAVHFTRALGNGNVFGSDLDEPAPLAIDIKPNVPTVFSDAGLELRDYRLGVQHEQRSSAKQLALDC